jgi:hypothetical protein
LHRFGSLGILFLERNKQENPDRGEKMAKGTAENAQFIAEQMGVARAALMEALKAVRAAEEAVKKGENEVEFKLPEFSNLGGLLSIAHSTAAKTRNTWCDNLSARLKR